MERYYRVEVNRRAERDLEGLIPRVRRRAYDLIRALSSEPRPPQCRKLSGSNNSYRLRVNDYRILYEVLDRERLVTVYEVGHRRDVYRRRRR